MAAAAAATSASASASASLRDVWVQPPTRLRALSGPVRILSAPLDSSTLQSLRALTFRIAPSGTTIRTPLSKDLPERAVSNVSVDPDGLTRDLVLCLNEWRTRQDASPYTKGALHQHISSTVGVFSVELDLCRGVAVPDCAVLKVLVITSRARLQEFINEAHYTRKAALLGVAPALLEVLIAHDARGRTFGLLLMERADVSLYTLAKMSPLESLPSDLAAFYRHPARRVSLFKQYIEQVPRLLATLHRNGIAHGDLHTGNIMLRRVCTEVPPPGSARKHGERVRFYIIDYGRAHPANYKWEQPPLEVEKRHDWQMRLPVRIFVPPGRFSYEVDYAILTFMNVGMPADVSGVLTFPMYITAREMEAYLDQPTPVGWTDKRYTLGWYLPFWLGDRQAESKGSDILPAKSVRPLLSRILPAAPAIPTPGDPATDTELTPRELWARLECADISRFARSNVAPILARPEDRILSDIPVHAAAAVASKAAADAAAFAEMAAAAADAAAATLAPMSEDSDTDDGKVRSDERRLLRSPPERDTSRQARFQQHLINARERTREMSPHPRQQKVGRKAGLFRFW